MMRGGMQQQASVSPVYSKKPDFTTQMSLRDHYLQDNNIGESEFSLASITQAGEDDVDELPRLAGEPSSKGTMSKFSRAIKRLRAARTLNTDDSRFRDPFHRTSSDYLRIKQLVCRDDLRHDVVMLPHTAEKQLDRSLGEERSGREPLAALGPSMPVLIVWNLIQFILFTYVIVYIPYRVSFAQIGELFWIGSGCGKDALIEGIDLFVDTFYLVDLVVSACTQTVSGRGVPLLHLKDTVPNYLLSWTFLRDVAPAVQPPAPNP